MYYEIESHLQMKPLIFDEEKLTVGDDIYPYDEIEDLQITRATIFSTFGILTLTTKAGKKVQIPFARSDMTKLKRAMRELEHEMSLREARREAADEPYQSASQSASQSTSQATSQAAPQMAREPIQYDPYEEVKKLKELLDMGIVTEEEFQKKKKELLGL